MMLCSQRRPRRAAVAVADAYLGERTDSPLSSTTCRITMIRTKSKKMVLRIFFPTTLQTCKICNPRGCSCGRRHTSLMPNGCLLATV